jgi:hypothetical protein
MTLIMPISEHTDNATIGVALKTHRCRDLILLLADSENLRSLSPEIVPTSRSVLDNTVYSNTRSS